MSGGFWPLPHAGHETSEADTHVESYEDILSDAGSTPAASTSSKRLPCKDLVDLQASYVGSTWVQRAGTAYADVI